jgi:hypothetical protein
MIGQLLPNTNEMLQCILALQNLNLNTTIIAFASPGASSLLGCWLLLLRVRMPKAQTFVDGQKPKLSQPDSPVPTGRHYHIIFCGTISWTIFAVTFWSSLWPCLVLRKFCKIFQIFRHIESFTHA